MDVRVVNARLARSKRGGQVCMDGTYRTLIANDSEMPADIGLARP